MQQIKKMFHQSAEELRKPSALVLTAVFVALNITLDLLNVRIQLTPQLRIGFGFLTNAMVGMLFGPVVAMCAGAATDFLGWVVNPGGGAYFPGFTVTAILAGLVWGVFLYQKKVTVWRALCAKGIINLFLNIGLNSIWLKIFYGKGMLAELPMRIGKNLLMLPIEVVLLFFVAKAVVKIYSRRRNALPS